MNLNWRIVLQMEMEPPVLSVGSLGYARELCAQQQWLAAKEEVKNAIQRRPFHPEAYNLLIDICKNQKDEGEAERYTALRQAIFSEDGGGQESGVSISACFIVKDEEKFIWQSLESIKPIADQVIVVDTGSSDNTTKIAHEWGAEVHHFKWVEDFSAARNCSLEFAVKDWILVLDADEEANPESFDALRSFVRQKKILGGTIKIRDAGLDSQIARVPRLFRNAPAAHFKGRIHEQVFPSLEKFAFEQSMKIGACDFEVIHHGYDSSVKVEKNKVQRNLALLEAEIKMKPDDPVLMTHYSIDLFNDGQQEEAIRQGRDALKLVHSSSVNRISSDVYERLTITHCNQLLVMKKFAQVLDALSVIEAAGNKANPSVLFLAAIAHMSVGSVPEAIPLLQTAIDRRQHKTHAPPVRDLMGVQPLILLGNCLAHEGRFPEAISVYRQVLSEDSSNYEIQARLKQLESSI